MQFEAPNDLDFKTQDCRDNTKSRDASLTNRSIPPQGVFNIDDGQINLKNMSKNDSQLSLPTKPRNQNSNKVLPAALIRETFSSNSSNKSVV